MLEMRSTDISTKLLNDMMVLSDEVLELSSTRFTVNNIDNRMDDLSVVINDLSSMKYRAEVILSVKSCFSEKLSSAS
jgi:hypothetical protein